MLRNGLQLEQQTKFNVVVVMDFPIVSIQFWFEILSPNVPYQTVVSDSDEQRRKKKNN